MQIVAEREILRYRGDHAAWHYHVHGTRLDPMQVLKMLEMDQHKYSLDYSCRRTGKTAVKELYLLEHNACHADQEVGIVAPREAQSLVNLGYHLDAIRRSPLLTAWIGMSAGRSTIADSYYKFVNRSVARAYGIMAQVDGGDMTAASLEEVDDMPPERLYSRFLLMLGSTRRLGASESAKNDPQIRITGVYKGADTLAEMVAKGRYHVLPNINIHLGIRMGILQPGFMAEMREQLSSEEYIRQLLCQNVSARNFIWESRVREAMQRGLEASLGLEVPMPLARYKKRGVVSIGYDAGGHGTSEGSSKHAFVVAEQLGNFVRFPFAKLWPADADDSAVKNDLKALWRYFQPDEAFGDAYGIGTLTQLNDELYAEGLTTIDRRTIEDGASNAHTWAQWAFKPIRFEGMTKHQMASAVRVVFHHGRAVMPLLSDEDAAMRDAAQHDMRTLQRQLCNIRKVPTQQAYDSYETLNKKVGDDLFDAAMAAVWGLAVRAAPPPATVILTSSRDTRKLLTAG